MNKNLSFASKNKTKTFYIFSIALILIGGGISFQMNKNAESEILPLLLSTKDHTEPLRTLGTFAEEFGPKASKAKFTFNEDSTFSFSYTKSSQKAHAFAGVWFPTENLNIDFSKYDAIEIEIYPLKARRIPFNLSVQNKLATHQYIRTVIEIEKVKTIYTCRLDDFLTPSEWYNDNKTAQIDIPKPDLSKIEAISFESCHLLDANIEDEFTISRITLVKDHTVAYIILFSCIAILIIAFRISLYIYIGEKKKVIHIPISPLELKEKEILHDKILVFLGENYTNSNLKLTDLSKEFGINPNEISTYIKEQTELTFPKYLNLLRIEEAKRILKSGKYSTISEVGYMVGFNSPSNFNRVFKSIVGYSPTENL